MINYVKEDILNNNTPEAIIFESVSDGMAAFYSQNLAREVMEKGLLPNAQKCMHNGGIPPLGLSVVNQKYIINEDEAIIVKQVFDWYINKDYGYDKIAQTLNDDGFLNKRGAPFKGTGIRELLLNEKYIGTYIYNRRSGANALGKRNNSKDKPQEEIVRIENAFPAIIDTDTFNKVKSIMNSRKGRNATHQAQVVYLLSGIAKCGKCGSNMHGNKKRTNRDKSFHITYKCNNRDRLGKKVCNCKELNKLYVERAIMHYISQMCEGNNLKLIMKELREYAKNQSDTSQDEALLKKRLSKAEKEIANIINAITKGFDADELKAQYSSLKEQKQDYQSKLAILEAQSLTKFTVDETTAKIALRQIKTDIESNQPLEEYKKLFATFLDSVNVFDDEVTINFNILSMIGSNAQSTGLPQNNRPPLETNQMVVWNATIV